ncbi:MAG TPA: FAD-binding protein, partial [Sedimentisphaerales bacterium]|nr:FAD-binding protein [Sedimentisphaerales bacterium]
EFARTLTAAGCCHGDTALVEGIGSLREFHHLVQAGVPFPTDALGGFIGYKTDHDPSERATSAGPKTSKFMSECLQEQLERHGVEIADKQEVAHLLTIGPALRDAPRGVAGILPADRGRDALDTRGAPADRRIAGVVTFDKASIYKKYDGINVYLGANIVLAAGGPGELYEASVYPNGQFGIHGLAFKAGLVGENLTESQFGLASTNFRWNVSGTYMQAIPRIFSTDSKGHDEREFLTDYFPSMSKMATAIFLKGYQWPFDPERIRSVERGAYRKGPDAKRCPLNADSGAGSSLIDILVSNETQNGRRVFMDFRCNPRQAPRPLGGGPVRPIEGGSMKAFDLEELEPEAYQYLAKAGALEARPIERLLAMNPLAVDIYEENGIDLRSEPLEIAVCAQHNNGGFAVNKWWESNIRGTFVIGEMAGTHGVKRPGGSALNAGQVGGLRAAEYIVNVYGCELPDYSQHQAQIDQQLDQLVAKFSRYKVCEGPMPKQMIKRIQNRMTASAGHIRELGDVRRALKEGIELYEDIQKKGLALYGKKEIVWAIRAEHLALTSIAYLKAIAALLDQGSGSRGSHLVVANDGIEIHPRVIDARTGKTLKFKPENPSLRDSVLRVTYDESLRGLFRCENAKLRAASSDREAFEPAWRAFREGKIYKE